MKICNVKIKIYLDYYYYYYYYYYNPILNNTYRLTYRSQLGSARSHPLYL